MIDIHCHILPGLDDGAQTLESSIEMAKAAVEEGIDTIIATPHHRNGRFVNPKENIVAAVDKLNEQLQMTDIPLTVLAGQEIRMNGDIVTELQQGIALSLHDTKYVFVEFPANHVPRYSEQMLFDMQLAGYIPIIVHPERNQEIVENPAILYEFVRKGTLSQVTAGSVCGKFGKKIQKFTNQLIEANLTHFLASDAHNTTSRRFWMQDALQILDHETAFLFMENSQLLKKGQNVNRFDPYPVRKKKILGLF